MENSQADEERALRSPDSEASESFQDPPLNFYALPTTPEPLTGLGEVADAAATR